MEDALKALLSQIYSAPSPASPAATGNADRALSPDEFRMYIYKVRHPTLNAQRQRSGTANAPRAELSAAIVRPCPCR